MFIWKKLQKKKLSAVEFVLFIWKEKKLLFDVFCFQTTIKIPSHSDTGLPDWAKSSKSGYFKNLGSSFCFKVKNFFLVFTFNLEQKFFIANLK